MAPGLRTRTSFTACDANSTIDLPLPPRGSRRGELHQRALAFLGTSFTTGVNDPPARAKKLADRRALNDETKAAAEDEAQEAMAALAHPVPRVWDNTEGLPAVEIKAKSDDFYSTNLGNSDDGESIFRPNFGCKCGDWKPAPAHPDIHFRPEFFERHPDFGSRIHKLQVKLVNTTDNVENWHAQYDLHRFFTEKNRAANKVWLTDNYPPDAWGKFPMFWTLCPANPGKPQEYKLTISGLDDRGMPISYLEDTSMTIRATPDMYTPPKMKMPPEETEVKEATSGLPLDEVNSSQKLA